MINNNTPANDGGVVVSKMEITRQPRTDAKPTNNTATADNQSTV